MKATPQTRGNRLFLCTFAIALTTATLAQSGYGQEKKAINIAGQEGTDDSNKLVAGGIGPETATALENIQKVLKAAGFELKDVVSVTVYLADIHEFTDMNKVYKGVMPDPKPARATIQAVALVNNARIEISAIAVKQK
jgi:2-iminobutanoate/2-iminopropanoate deaminase